MNIISKKYILTAKDKTSPALNRYTATFKECSSVPVAHFTGSLSFKKRASSRPLYTQQGLDDFY